MFRQVGTDSTTTRLPFLPGPPDGLAAKLLTDFISKPGGLTGDLYYAFRLVFIQNHSPTEIINTCIKAQNMVLMSRTVLPPQSIK